jgi:hypothetical protein
MPPDTPSGDPARRAAAPPRSLRRAQSRTPVAESMATASPRRLTRILPGSPRILPEWRGNWAWRNTSPRLPLPGT